MTNDKNKFLELTVGYFFLAIVLFIVIMSIVLTFKGEISFFNAKYTSYYEFGSGLNKGTLVTLNGINIGEVTKVSIDERNRIEVLMVISKKYSPKIRRDSVAKVVRSMLIGGKQISISPGSPESPLMPSGSVIRSSESSELVDLISGISIDGFIKDLDIKKSLFNFSGDSMITAREVYEQGISAILIMNEFQKSLKDMSFTMFNLSKSISDMGYDLQSMSTLSESIQIMSDSFTELSALSSSMSSMGKSIEGVNAGFNGVTKAMNGITNEAQSLKPSLEKLDYMIDDVSILLLAMQKSWMFRNEVDLVKREREKELSTSNIEK